MNACVLFPFILNIKFVGRTSRGHTGGRSHRISHPPSFCGACLNFSREKGSTVPFPRRPCFFVLTISSFSTRWAFVLFTCPQIEIYLVYKQIQTSVLYCASTYYIHTYLPRMHLHCARTLNLLVELTTSRFGNLTRLIYITLLYVSGGRTY